MNSRVLKKMIALSFLLSLLLFASAAQADGVAPHADEVFTSITITLYSNRKVDYEAVTQDICSYIEVSACSLYQLINGEWKYIRALRKPSGRETDDLLYSRTVSYTQSEIGSGTYKIGARFTADGHSVTRYSNQKTF